VPILRAILNGLRDFGFDPLKTLKALKGSGRFLGQAIQFRLKSKNSNFKISLALTDYSDSAGSARGHYFWQDLICAQWIYDSRSSNHFDCGSRIDGFIAHLIPFTKVVQVDIRPMTVEIPNLEIVIGNAQENLSVFAGKYQSVSSLHSIEHFGLGRYGDPIDPNGHVKGLKNISECVSAGGTLYVSFPIGKASVEFNAQRVIDPMWPIEQLPGFKLEDFVLIPWVDAPVYGMHPSEVDKSVWGQAGLYKFSRV